MQPTNPTPTPPTSPASPAAPNPSPVMDVVAPPPAEKPDPAEPAADAKKSAAQPKPEKQAPVKVTTSKRQSNGIGPAIFATVVIVLGLAALATYAYIKTK